jgi:endonuclease YncB( thermonuclease family)
LALSLLAAACARYERFTGKVVGITDGDTLTILRAGRPERIRLSGIDAPEGRQAFGRRSRQHLSSLAFGREATVHVEGKDQYGRLIARVLVDDVDVGLEQVREGFGWHFTRYSSDRRLAAAEREARAARRGLWADGSARPPWEFRRGSR